MSTGPVAGHFTFVWEIKNFLFSPLVLKEYYETEYFEVKTLSATLWKLRLYPRGTRDDKFISVFLIRAEYYGPFIMEIDFTLTIEASDLSWQKSRKSISKEFNIATKSGYDKFCRRDILEKNSQIFLPNETLTLSCYMVQKNTEETLEPFAEHSRHLLKLEDPLLTTPLQVLSVSNRFRNLTNSCCPYQSTYLTNIIIESFCFTWTIEGISKLKPQESVTFDKNTVGILNNFSVDLSFQLCETMDSESYAKILIDKSDNSCLFLRCSIAAGSVQSCFQEYAVDQYLYGSNFGRSWKFKPFLKSSNIRAGNYIGNKSDQLVLLLRLTFSVPDQLYKTPNASSRSTEKFQNTTTLTGSSNEFLTLYSDRIYCDVWLRAEDRTFPAHKCIISAKSSVFHAMLEKDMKEKSTGEVDIDDVEADILDRMLKFIYSGVIDDCCRDTIMKLYYAADKYHVKSLRKQCSSILKSSLTVSNVSEILALADLHHDQDLTKAAENFIFIYSNETFSSSEWNIFMGKYPKAAAETMQRISLRLLEI